ncbi:MAG: DUF4115 domain-containing protein [Phascolarctobacterium sp.]|nr:DUF4115 domain-containing protein [Phascolarctobacterium sp.]
MDDKELDIQEQEEISIGTILRRARNAKNISIEQAEEDTKIRPLYLRALEADDYDKLPGETFLKGMMRTYGNYLGLNGPELVQQYRASQTGLARGEMATQGIREAENVRMNIQLKTQRDIGSGTGRMEMPHVNWPVVLASVGLVALLGIGYVAVPKVITWMNTPKEAVTETVTQKEPEKTATEKPQVQVDGYVVEIEAIDKCWFEAYGDGRELASIMLYAGDKKKYEAKDKIRLKFGNMGACKVSVNGEAVALEGITGVHILEYAKDK